MAADFKISVTLDASGVKSGASEARREVQSIAKVDFKEIATHLQGLGSKIREVGSLLTKAVTLPLAGLATLGIRSALEMDKVRTKLTALLGDSEKANQKLLELQTLAANSVGVTQKAAYEGFAQLKGIGGLADETINKVIASLGKLNAAFTIDDISGFQRNLVQIFSQGFEIADIKEAIGRVPIFRQLLSQAFGTDDPAKLKALKDAGKLTLDQFLSGLSGAINNDPRIGNIQENLTVKMTKAFERMNVALAPLGQVILDVLVPAIEALSPYVQQLGDWFNSLSPTVKAIVVGMGALAAALGPVLVVMGGLISMVGTLVSAGTAGGLVILAVVGFLTQLGLICGVVAAEAAVLYAAWQTNFGGIRDLVMTVVEGVKAMWADLSANLQQLTGELMAQLKTFWEQNGNDIMQAVTAVSDFIKSIWTEILAFWQAHGESIKATTATVWEFIKVAVKGGMEAVLNIIKLVTAIINGDWSKAWDALKGIVSGVLKAVVGIIAGYQTAVVGAVKIILQGIWDLGVWINLKGVELGKQVVAGLIHGITYVPDALATAARNLGQRVISELRSQLKIQSPSKVTEEIGRFVVEGLTVGMGKLEPQAVQQAASIGGKVGGALNAAFGGNFQDFLRGAFDTLLDGTKSFGDRVRSVFHSIAQNFRRMVSDMATAWLSSILGMGGGGSAAGASGSGGILGGIFGGSGGGTPPFVPSGSGGGGFGGFGGFHWPGDRSGTFDANGNYVVDGRSRWQQLTGAGGIFGSQGFGNNVGTYGAFGAMAGIAGGLIGGRVGGFISGAGAGLAMGAQIGSLIAPGIGTAIGAVVGAIGGGLMSLFGGDPKRKKDKKENMPALQKGFLEAIADLERLKNDRMAIYNDPDGTLSKARDIRSQIAAGFGIEFLSKKYRKIAQQKIKEKLAEADKLIAELEQTAGTYKYARQVDERIVTSFAGGVFMSPAFMKQFGEFKRRNGFLGGRFTGSDTLPSMLAPGEMVLNPYQVARVKSNAGMDPFERAGIPGYSTGAVVSSQSQPMTAASMGGPIVVQPQISVTIEGEGITDARIRSVMVDGVNDPDFQVELVRGYDKGKTRGSRGY